MRECEPKVSYLSALAPHLYQFVDEKRVLGYRYRTQAHWLVAFDRFLLEQGATTPDLPEASRVMVLYARSEATRISHCRHLT